MDHSFDKAAATYDQDFTDTPIGQIQRGVVYSYLDKVFKEQSEVEILELNCGTGTDAIWFAARGYKVLATDISGEMLGIAQKKVSEAGFGETVRLRTLDMNDISALCNEKKFDLIYSNFGGLNCIPPESIRRLYTTIHDLLTPNGHFIASVMPKACLWEWFYFTLKGESSNSKRRRTKGPVPVNIGGTQVNTWYYSPGDLKNLSGKDFSTRALRPVGLFVPPSYLGGYFGKRKGLLRILKGLDGIFGGLSFTSSYADHYIIHLEVRR